MSPDPGSVRVGVLGCGHVGAPLIRLVAAEADRIAERTGVHLEIARVAVRSLSKDRDVDLPEGVLTTDAASVVDDPTIDVIVELIGGIEPARELTVAALKSGKPVVTGNKELLANVGSELFAAADAAGVDVLFEAAVAGGIPFVRPLRESLLGDNITRITGIVNGTTNYILDQMTHEGADYHDALTEAQRLGYAERDPTADVEGFDAGAKAAIIASIAFGKRVVAGDVTHEGISRITPTDIGFATRLGYVIKLIAVIEQVNGGIAPRVHPAMVHESHPLASVRGNYNAIFVEGEWSGELMFYGLGAGGRPTAAAVLGDLIDAAANLRKSSYASIGPLAKAEIVPVDDLASEYYLNIEVTDEPGVLATVAGVFGGHGVSISSMQQEGLGHDARLIFITHEARESDVRSTIRDLRRLSVVRDVRSVLRVIPR